VSAFAREVLELADLDPTEAQADVLDAQDPRAVQLCTIHQAKGLEWPIVLVPDLCAQPKTIGDRILFDRRLGLAIKPWLGDEDVTRTPRYARIWSERTRRERAEYLRTLYVALTRARERLVLSGAGKTQKNTWWDFLDAAITQDDAIRAKVRDIAAADLPAPEPQSIPEPEVTAEQERRVDALLARVRGPAPAVARSLVLPVTHLQDFHRCPRRYLYAHQVGLSEYPVVFDFDEDAGEGRAVGDSRFKGTVAHKLLERAPLGLVGQRGLHRALEELCWQEHIDPRAPDGEEILAWVERFLATRFAQRLAAADASRVHRELPFLLQLTGDDGFALFLKGQIDLLFEDDDGAAVVIDYKASVRPRSGLDSYGFQLGCYALAARRFVKDGVAVRTGIAFLREVNAEPEIAAKPSPLPGWGEGQGEGSGLIALARSLLSSRWEGRELPACEAMGCGYTYRCHPKS